MELLHRRCCGLDVHKETVVACLRLVADGKVTTEVRTFQTITSDLLRLSEWLAANECTHVAMEATGVYWKPVWHILDDGEFVLVLANAAHVKNVPGRKTDVNDAMWLAELLAHGLIRASFVPDTQTQEMRNLLRTRKQLVREQSSHVLRVQKTLEDANIKLDSVLSDLMGKSGRAMLEALIAGETNPTKLASLANRRVKASPEEFREVSSARLRRCSTSAFASVMTTSAPAQGWSVTSLMLCATLTARDEGGNEGRSEPFAFRLPERAFTKPPLLVRACGRTSEKSGGPFNTRQTSMIAHWPV